MTIDTETHPTRATSTRADPAPAAQVWPLAPLQTGLLYHAVCGEGGLDVYTMQSTYTFAPGLDLGALEWACASLLARHGALRAGFSAALLDRPVQFVPDRVVPPWRVVDLREKHAGDAAAAEAQVEQIQVQERQRRFDMDAPPLIRFVAVDLGSGGVRLVVTNHHIVIDGWSDALLVVELLQHLAAGGCDESLPEAPQFRDYLAWLAGRDAESDRAAWRAALTGLAAGTTLADADPDREATFPDVTEIDLGPDLSAAVEHLARACAVSTNTVYSSVWALLLRTLTGSDDVVFGTTVSGRPADLPGVESMVGLFLNTVPHRVRTVAGESVQALLQRLQAEQAALVEHHHVGLATIQQDAGLGALFDTLYVMRNTPTDDESFARLSQSVGLTDIDGGDATHYPATFIVHPGDSTRLILSHRRDIIDADAAEDLLQRAACLLAAMTEEPHRPVGSLPTLDPQAQAELVRSWVGSAHPVPQESLCELLDRTVARVGHRCALVDEAGSMTFAQFGAAVQARAQALVRAGVRPGDLVTIELPRSSAVVVAIFAVLSLRAAYVPIEVNQPPARQAALRVASGARWAITPDDDALRLDTDAPTGAAGPDYRHDDLAYVMFTSGSTGAPKGVAVTHTGLVNMLGNHRRRIFEPAGAGPDTPWRVAHAVSFAFDMSWEELLWLLDGHEVHLLSEQVRRDPLEMTDYLRRHRIDVINVTPSVAAALLADGLLESETGTPRLVLLGGEAVGADVWSALRDAPHTHGYNLYGPTEYTINTLGGGTQDSATPIVGVPIDNTDVRVLDSALQPVPDGVPGELYITGAGLARGYHRAAGLTAERFVADPFGAPGSRMYRSGDVVSRRPDGVFDFHGRSDGQVKIRGHRVEPGEVQAVLAADDRVARCAVLARRMPTGASALIGYVVATPEAMRRAGSAQALHADLIDTLAARLPEAMVPASLVEVEDLPLTANSKLDVSRLPVPTLHAGGGRPARGPAQKAVCDVFAEVLGVPAVAADDNFFALGGHSLLAMRAVTLIGERLGRRVGVAALLAAPTPAGLVTGFGAEHDPFAVVLPLGGHTGRGHTPIFCVHPMLGLGWTFSAFAAQFATSTRRGHRDAPPVYALQSPALRDPYADPADLTVLADDLIDAAHRACAATGDDLTRTGCHLIGWSFGGHLAHVMASRLSARGINVASLTLLDPGAPVASGAPAGDEAGSSATATDPTSADDLQSVLAFLLAAGLRDVPEWMTPPYDVHETLEFLADGTGAFAGLGAPDLEALRRVAALNDRLLRHVEYGTVTADTVLVTSTVTQAPQPGAAPHHPHTDTAETAQAWRSYCTGAFTEHRVDVPHDLLTSPYAAERLAPLVPLHTPPAPTHRTTASQENR